MDDRKQRILAKMHSLVSQLPIVDLGSIAEPQAGVSDDDVAYCCRKFAENDQCKKHYEALACQAAGTTRQCPHGFSSLHFLVNGRSFALTSFIPFPRAGGEKERKLSKSHPNKKISIRSVIGIAENTANTINRLREIEKSVAAQQSMALHEIRKLNRTVKHTAERLCAQIQEMDESIKGQVESIFKAAELMSGQFDVLELIANEDLANLPCTTVSEPFRVFDKLARIYRQGNTSSNIKLACQSYYPKVLVCDKTFPILASVLLSNATKYSIAGTEIQVDFLPLAGAPNRLKIVISNVAIDHPGLDRRIFEKGYRVAQDSDGTGKGLYLAQLVAKQHGSQLKFSKEKLPDFPSRVRCTFTIALTEYVQQ